MKQIAQKLAIEFEMPIEMDLPGKKYEKKNTRNNIKHVVVLQGKRRYIIARAFQSPSHQEALGVRQLDMDTMTASHEVKGVRLQ